MGQTGRKEIKTGAELVEFLHRNKMSFQMATEEADLLCRYTEWQGCFLGGKDGQLLIGNQNAGINDEPWEEITIDSLVDAACEYNYSLLQAAEKEREQSGYFQTLCADEKMLDAMFDRTVYGKRLEQMAQAVAGSFLETLQQEENMERATEKLVQDIKAVTGAGQEKKPIKQTQKGKAR